MPTIIQWDSIPHDEQRYNTIGDWFFVEPDMLRIRVSKMSDLRYEILVALHETTEALIARQHGIAEEDVTAFDQAYEESRLLGLNAECGCAIQEEPGDDPHCPVYAAHQAATQAEKILAEALHVDWEAYADEVGSLTLTTKEDENG